jgi:hypothetical protein
MFGGLVDLRFSILFPPTWLAKLAPGSVGEKLNDWNMIGPPEGFVGSYGNHVGIIWVSFGNHFENIATKQ